MTVAFIPSKGRPELADRCVTSILKHGRARPVVVIEPSQEDEYSKMFGRSASGMLAILPEDGRGIGYARAHIVKMAAHNNRPGPPMLQDARNTSICQLYTSL